MMYERGRKEGREKEKVGDTDGGGDGGRRWEGGRQRERRGWDGEGGGARRVGETEREGREKGRGRSREEGGKKYNAQNGHVLHCICSILNAISADPLGNSSSQRSVMGIDPRKEHKFVFGLHL